MISQEDRSRIIEIAKRFHVSKVLLFGSSADPEKEGRDIDLAVEGVPPSQFFDFYGRLMMALSKPVDLVDLGDNTEFTDIVRREGVLVYG